MQNSCGGLICHVQRIISDHLKALPRDTVRFGFPVPRAARQGVSWNLSPFSPIIQNRRFVLFSSWEFIGQNVFMAFIGKQKPNSGWQQKCVFGLFKHYLKPGSSNVLRCSKQASAKLVSLQQRTLGSPHSVWDGLSWGTNANQRKGSYLTTRKVYKSIQNSLLTPREKV